MVFGTIHAAPTNISLVGWPEGYIFSARPFRILGRFESLDQRAFPHLDLLVSLLFSP
jgi:hypothetical protein